jgi:hypothetical protein
MKWRILRVLHCSRVVTLAWLLRWAPREATETCEGEREFERLQNDFLYHTFSYTDEANKPNSTTFCQSQRARRCSMRNVYPGTCWSVSVWTQTSHSSIFGATGPCGWKVPGARIQDQLAWTRFTITCEESKSRVRNTENRSATARLSIDNKYHQPIRM